MPRNLELVGEYDACCCCVAVNDFLTLRSSGVNSLGVDDDGECRVCGICVPTSLRANGADPLDAAANSWRARNCAAPGTWSGISKEPSFDPSEGSEFPQVFPSSVGMTRLDRELNQEINIDAPHARLLTKVMVELGEEVGKDETAPDYLTSSV